MLVQLQFSWNGLFLGFGFYLYLVDKDTEKQSKIIINFSFVLAEERLAIILRWKIR